MQPLRDHKTRPSFLRHQRPVRRLRIPVEQQRRNRWGYPLPISTRRKMAIVALFFAAAAVGLACAWRWGK